MNRPTSFCGPPSPRLRRRKLDGAAVGESANLHHRSDGRSPSQDGVPQNQRRPTLKCCPHATAETAPRRLGEVIHRRPGRAVLPAQPSAGLITSDYHTCSVRHHQSYGNPTPASSGEEIKTMEHWRVASNASSLALYGRTRFACNRCHRWSFDSLPEFIARAEEQRCSQARRDDWDCRFDSCSGLRGIWMEAARVLEEMRA